MVVGVGWPPPSDRHLSGNLVSAFIYRVFLETPPPKKKVLGVKACARFEK